MSRTTRRYGTWSSPISAPEVASSGVGLAETWLEGETAYWLELRPAEHGRTVLVRAVPSGSPEDVTPAGFDVRTRVHEYGGGSYVVHGDTVFFSNFADQRLYRQDTTAPHPITPEPPTPASIRYADGRVTPDGRRLICVRERHDAGGVTNELVVLPTDGSAEPDVLASGHDFFAAPRISPDGRRVAWICWDQPRMPWDGTELHVADLAADGTFADDRVVAGGDRESIFQPAWTADGTLHFVSDRTGWWNLYRRTDGGDDENLTPLDAEFGVPMWEFGYATSAFLGDGRIVCSYRAGGVHHLGVLDPVTLELVDLDLPYTCFDPPYLQASDTRLLFVAAGTADPRQVVTVDFTSRSVDVLRISRELSFDPAFVSVAEPIEFPTEAGRTAFAYFYRPTSPNAEGPADERPPLIVMTHGGPTAETTPELRLDIQYFTSRGLGVVDVNYGGSTGYGREYRERLYGELGVVDVRDCVNAARFLVDRGDADVSRLLITGGSAGGYTTICALAWTDVFAAGASYYGLADLEPFATSTHKFELRYTDVLVGPWPDARQKWRERSPIHSFDRISCPVMVLQGLDDEVVPPEQAELMVAALRARGVPYAYLAFEGEQHGFRQAENIRRSLEAELSFYAQVLGFELGDPVEPVRVENLR